MKKVMSFLETLSRAVAAHRLAQLGYTEEAKRLMTDHD
jgi:hypothetical protein